MTTTDYSKLTREELIARVQALECTEAARRAEAAVVDAKFKAVFEQGLLLVGITDLEGRLLEVNTLALEVCGYRREDVLGVPIWKSGWFNQIPGLAEKVQFAIREAAAGKTFRADIAYSWADGSEHFADYGLSPVKDESGRVIFLSSIGVDISKRKQVEAVLTEQERLLRLVTDGAPTLISYIDAEFHYRSINKAWLEWFGKSGPAVEGRTVLEVLGETGWQDVRPMMERTLAGESITFERRLVHPDRSIRWLEIKYVPDRDGAGRVVGFVAHAYDITRRKLAEENLSLLNVTLDKQVTDRTAALIRSEERIKVAAESGQIGIWEWNVKTNEVIWDDVMFALYGARREDFSGAYEAWASRLHPEDKAASEAVLSEAVADRRGYSLEFRIIWPDGSVHWIESHARPVRDEAGHLVWMLGTNTDLTEARRREHHATFLEQLQTELSPMTVPSEVIRVACMRIAAHLTLSHCALVETNEESDICTVVWDANAPHTPNLAGDYRLSDFHSEEERAFLRTGAVLVVEDVRKNERSAARTEQFEALSIRSLVNAAYLADGRWKFVLHCSRIEPSGWLPADLELLTELTARVCLLVQRTRAEESLRESERRLRALFDQAGVGVAELDSRTGRFLYVNHKNLEILGLTREEMLSMTFMDITHPDDLSEDVVNMERMLKGENRGFTMEKRLLRKDRSAIWVNLNVSPLWQPGEVPTSHIAVVRDITEHRRAQDALRASEAKFRHLFESAPEAIFLLATGDDAGRILDASPVAEAMHGYSPGEMHGMRIQDVDVPSAAVLAQERLRRLEAGERLTFELEHFRKDGSIFPLEVQASMITMGEARFILAFERDITERHHADAALHASQQRLEMALSATDAGVWDWNVKTGEVRYDSGWAGMLGYTVEEVEMEFAFWEKNVHPDDLPGVLVVLNAHMTGQSPDYLVEHRLRHKNGSWVWVQSTGRIVERDVEGHPQRACGTHLNITLRKQMETTLVASKKLAATGRLAASIAHEINNPLNGIKNCFRLVKEALPPEDSAQRYAGLIDREIDRIATIVRRMFTLYRPGKADSAEFSLNQLVQDTANLIQPTLVSRNQRALVTTPENPVRGCLPEAT